MTNGDRIRTFSDEQLALITTCPVEACLTLDNEPITIKRDCGKCLFEDIKSCIKCTYEWLQQEESKMSDNLKYDDNKPRLDLVPPELIEAVGIVRTYGVSKYGDSKSWKQVEPYRYRAALMRHICLYLEEPDGVDAESGLPHLWHIACNVAFLIALNAEKRPISDFKAKTVNLPDKQ